MRLSNKLFCLLMMVAVSGCLCGTPVKGTKVGVITKLADEGVFCTTHEGQLVRGGLSGGSGTLGGVVDFNIQNDALMAEAQAAMEAGQEVEITYERPLIASACSREHKNDVIATKIRVLSKSETKPDD